MKVHAQHFKFISSLKVRQLSQLQFLAQLVYNISVLIMFPGLPHVVELNDAVFRVYFSILLPGGGGGAGQ